MSALLLDERSVAVQPSLVRALGLTSAIVCQQIHWHLREGHGEELDDGHRWVPLPIDRFVDETGLTIDQVRRAVRDLESRGVVVSTQPEGYDRTKWYRVDRDNDLFAPECPSGREPTSIRRTARFEAGPGPLHSSQNSKNSSRARASESDDSSRTAAAHALIADRQQRHAAELDAEQRSPRFLSHIAEARARLRGHGPDPVTEEATR